MAVQYFVKMAGTLFCSTNDLLLIHFLCPLGDSFVWNLQHNVYTKPWELGSWDYERILTPHQVSHVICHMSYVICQVSWVMCQVSGVGCWVLGVGCWVSGVRCQVSGVRCQVSGVRCQVSGVICHMSCVTFFVGQSGGASRWRVCSQRGLPRLDSHISISLSCSNKKETDYYGWQILRYKVSENRTKEIYYLSNKKFHPCWYFVVFMLHWHYKYGIQIGNFNKNLTYLQRPLAGETKAVIMLTLLWHNTVPRCRLLFIISNSENLHRMEFRGNIFFNTSVWADKSHNISFF